MIVMLVTLSSHLNLSELFLTEKLKSYSLRVERGSFSFDCLVL